MRVSILLQSVAVITTLHLVAANPPPLGAIAWKIIKERRPCRIWPHDDWDCESDFICRDYWPQSDIYFAVHPGVLDDDHNKRSLNGTHDGAKAKAERTKEEWDPLDPDLDNPHHEHLDAMDDEAYLAWRAALMVKRGLNETDGADDMDGPHQGHLTKRSSFLFQDIDTAKLPPPDQTGSQCCHIAGGCATFFSDHWLMYSKSHKTRAQMLTKVVNWKKGMCCIQDYWTPKPDCVSPTRNVPINFRTSGRCNVGIEPMQGIHQMGDPFAPGDMW